MPISRKKACHQCRTAKARCNLIYPCSRCLERGLECIYHDHVGGNASAIGALLDGDLGNTHIFNRNMSSNPSGPSQMTNAPNSSRNADSTGVALPPFPDWDLDTMGDNFAVDCFHTGHPMFSTANFIETQNPSTIENALQPNSPKITTGESFRDLDSYTPSIMRSPEPGPSLVGLETWVPEVEKGLKFIYGRCFQDVLLPKSPTTIQSSLMAQVLWGQLRAYPEMLVHGQLPPFIYPKCVLDGRLPKDCIVNGVHNCLPQPLAICCSLVRMFYGRTSENSSFFWSTMHAEQVRLKEKHHTFDEHELLAALQAVNIYVILQAQDLSSINQNDLDLQAGLAMVLGQRLWQLVPHHGNMYREPTLTHREWAYSESIIRTVDLGYIFGCLMNALLGRKSITCSGTGKVPLAGPRLLWDYTVRESWAQRFDEFSKKDRPSEPMCIADLMAVSSRQKNARTWELAQWCQGIDEFGMLLWMTTTLG